MFKHFRNKRCLTNREKLQRALQHERFMVICLEEHLTSLNNTIAATGKCNPSLIEVQEAMFTVIEYFEGLRDATAQVLRGGKDGAG